MSEQSQNPFLPDDEQVVDVIESPTTDDECITLAVDTGPVIETTDKINNVVDAVEALESIALQLRKAAKYGGVSAESYGYLTIATNAATASFPKLNKKTSEEMPSLEDFAIRPLDNTTTSLERVGEAISKGYEALKTLPC